MTTNTLDLIITQEDSNLTIETSQGLLFSDHNVIQLSLHTEGKLSKARQILYGKKTRELTLVLLKKGLKAQSPISDSAKALQLII